MKKLLSKLGWLRKPKEAPTFHAPAFWTPEDGFPTGDEPLVVEDEEYPFAKWALEEASPKDPKIVELKRQIREETPS
ncbi:MAG: hypothetical protein JST30_08500 [Armatimonadetes bacterium]|nr:hypothetical protein [Armatimonadota bacterium]